MSSSSPERPRSLKRLSQKRTVAPHSPILAAIPGALSPSAACCTICARRTSPAPSFCERVIRASLCASSSLNPRTRSVIATSPAWTRTPCNAPDQRSRILLAGCTTKPAFRDAFRRRRCLVPVDGFYEWQKRPAGKKQPYAIVSADGKPFAMAGLWENWKEPQSGETVRTFTIITGPPNDLVAPIHNRMPVILPPSQWRAWLGEEPAPAEELQALLQPYPADLMRTYPVNMRVGNTRNNDAALIEPVALAS